MSATSTPRVLLTPEQAADAIGIGRTTLYALIKSGDLQSIKVGRLRRVPEAAVNRYIERLMAEQHSATERN